MAWPGKRVRADKADISGKSTIGQQVADALHLPFVDGDSLHPLSNVEKMSNGIPLTDDDRLPWLALIRSTGESAVTLAP